MVDNLPALLAAPVRGGGAEPRLVILTVAATVGTAALILLTLPTATTEPGMLTVGTVVVGGAAATIAGYFGVPRLAWLPYVPATATLAVLVAGTGGSASPYWPLLLVLLVGGATMPHPRDLLVVAGLVAAAGLSPLAYEAWSEFATASKVIHAASWILATTIVARVSASLRAAPHRVEERTRLVSAVLGSLPQHAAVVDRSGRILLTNDAWDRVHVLSGAPPVTFTAGAAYQTACTNRDGAVMVTPTDLVDDLQHVLTGGATTAVSELSWELLVGEHHRFTVRTTALPDRLGAVVTHEDITRLVEAERTRQRSLDRLRELDEHKMSLLQAVSHDVRTPLTIINGTAATLQRQLEGLEPADIEQLVDALAHQARRLARLLSGLLILTTSEDTPPDALGITVQRQPNKPRDIIDTVLDRLDAADRTLTVTGAEHDLVVGVDGWILDAILERLLDNAVRHTPPGTPIEIDVALAPGPRLVVRVNDDGPGIPAADRERIFEPFEHGTDGRAHDPGAGIGLSVVRAAARLHGGDAWFDPTARGASFRVELEVDPA